MMSSKIDFTEYFPYLAGITFSVVFGFSFLFSQEALQFLDPFQLLGFRFLLAAIFMTSLKWIGFIETNIFKKPLLPLLLVSLFQPGIYFPMEILGIERTTSSQAGLMISLIPVSVALLAAIFLKEKPSKLQLTFILLSVLGVGIVVSFQGELASDAHYLGLVLLLGAVIAAGFYNIISRYISVDFTPVEITFSMCYFGAIQFNLIGYFNYSGSAGEYLADIVALEPLLAVVYLGILSSVVAFFMMNYSLSKLPASQAAVFANLTTVVSILAGVFLANEPFYPMQVVGAALIIFGVWGTNYFGSRKKVAQKSVVNTQESEV